MKKIYSWMLAAVCVSALSVSCKQDALEPSTPDEGKTVKVEVSLAEELKGTMLDSKGIVWEVGDQIKYAGGAELTSSPLTAEDISSDGSVASFTFDAALTEVDRNGWFVSTKNHPTSYTEVEYTLGTDNGNVYTQDVAGEMNHRRLFLHSGLGTMDVAKGQEKITVKMDVCGTIFRAMPYTTLYNSEKIESVTLSSNSYIVGTVAYDRGAQSYKPIAGNGYEGATVDWKKYNNVVVNLGTAFALDGVTSKETSKGIYFPVAASYEGYPYKGYKWVISTDKARYVFDAMDKDFAVGENVVKNVYLNLDKATRSEHVAGTLRYEAVWKTVELAPGESKDNYCGYSVAMTKDGEEAEVKRESAEYYELYYKNVAFTCTDPDSGEPVDWVTVRYSTTNAHVLADVSENTGAERKALVTITYSDVRNYTIEESSKTKTFTITQKAAGAKKVITFFANIGDQTIDAEALTNFDTGAYVCIDIDGQHAENWQNEEHQQLYANATFNVYVLGTGVGETASVADWLTVSYGKDSEGKFNSTHVFLTATKNTGVERQALVYCVYTAPEGYEFENGEKTAYKQFIVTQKSGMTINASFENVYSNLVSASGETINAANLKVEVNGSAVSDYTKLSEYGLSLTSSAGTLTVSENGSITFVVPENKPNKEKTYTISLKQDSKLLASCEIKQAAGTEEVSDTHTYQYTIFNKAEDGSNGTGFGPDVVGTVGEWYRIENVVIDGYTYKPGDDLKNLISNTDLINALTSHIFSFGEITESDVQVPGTDPLTTNPESFVEIVPWTDGGAAIYFRIVFKNKNTTGVRRTFKIITKDGNGDVTSTIVYFQNA